MYCSRKANKLPIRYKLVNYITEPWQLPKLTRVEVCILHQAIEQLLLVKPRGVFLPGTVKLQCTTA